MFSIVRHVTITHDALALTVQGPPSPQDMGPHCTRTPPPRGPFMDMGPHCTGPHRLVTFGGKNLIPVQTCSVENTPPQPVPTSGG